MSNTPKKGAPGYTEAFEELQAIVQEIEQGGISVDNLSERVKRAALLIRICKDKLTSTEEDVSKILKELESNTAGASSGVSGTETSGESSGEFPGEG